MSWWRSIHVHWVLACWWCCDNWRQDVLLLAVFSVLAVFAGLGQFLGGWRILGTFRVSATPPTE